MVDEAGGECVTIRADVRSSTRMGEAMREALFEYGRIDICIASAGVVSFGSVESLSDQQWRAVIDTNLTGTFNTVRAIIPPMVKAGYGRIVTVASMGGRAGAPRLGHYAASKWGVIGLTKTIALELAGTGVTANVLCPTTVSTDMVHNPAMYALFAPDLVNPDQDQVQSRYASLNPMRVPWMDTSDVTGAMLYLVSGNARYVSGATVEISAGVSARLP
ncbi:SDR family oxidoreductase [Gordonia sp. NPDC127522]|uniref:SDR family oxidoreductase n=1 Tax=Gordonia sp. NPDC127522 TaxID=3345390 RepID=UPI00362B1766